MTQQQMAAGAAAPPPATNWQQSPAAYWQSPQAPGQAWSPASFGRRLRSAIEHGERAVLLLSGRHDLSASSTMKSTAWAVCAEKRR